MAVFLIHLWCQFGYDVKETLANRHSFLALRTLHVHYSRLFCTSDSGFDVGRFRARRARSRAIRPRHSHGKLVDGSGNPWIPWRSRDPR